MNILVIGLGNPILGDDGVGWRVAELVQQQVKTAQEPVSHEGDPHTVEFDCAAEGGLGLMERMVGYDRAIIIDAVTTGKFPQGAVTTFRLEALPDLFSKPLVSAHNTSLKTALQMGRAMHLRLPEEVIVVGIETQNTDHFSEELTPRVAEAVPLAVKAVMHACFTAAGAASLATSRVRPIRSKTAGTGPCKIHRP